MSRGHRLAAAIMLGSLVASACDGTVQPSRPTPSPPASPPAASPHPAIESLRPDPNAGAYELRDPVAPARRVETTHDVELVIHERYMTVAAGFVQAVWAIGSTVPGPVIRVQVGDTVRIHLVNRPPKGSYPAAHPAANDYRHAVGFAGSTDATMVPRTPLEPGEETAFAFKADRPGVWLYHGTTEPLLQNVTNGMYGMMIVEPQDGLDDVARELFFVQGEWYLGGQHPPAPPLPSLAKAAAEVPAPDFIVLNGVAAQYQDHPIQIASGERVRVFILNAGPNLDMSFRVEGAVFDRVIRNGVEIAVGNEAGGAGPAVDLAPGEGAIVEFAIDEDGTYPFLTHAAGVSGPGAAGLFQVGPATR